MDQRVRAVQSGLARQKRGSRSLVGTRRESESLADRLRSKMAHEQQVASHLGLAIWIRQVAVEIEIAGAGDEEAAGAPGAETVCHLIGSGVPPVHLQGQFKPARPDGCVEAWD